MKSINIATALKLKNRKIRDGAKLVAKFTKLASAPTTAKSMEDAVGNRERFSNEVSALLPKIMEGVKDVAKFRADIAKANVDNQENLMMLSELKSLKSKLGNMYIDGTEPVEECVAPASRITEMSTTYKSYPMTTSEFEKMVDDIQSEIDNLQDKVDVFNATHKI